MFNLIVKPSGLEKTLVTIRILLSNNIVKSQKEMPEKERKESNNIKQGRWTKEEHYRFLEALKLYGKEWRKVQQHVCTRTST
jgi:hypothetical protein